MKKISEAELNSEFSLEHASKQATLTFWCGIAGAVSCVVIFVLFRNYWTSIQSMIAEKTENGSIIAYDARIEINQAITEKTIAMNQIVLPMFMGANFAWIVGGFAWSFDIGKRPSNRNKRLIGSVLVVATAPVCCDWWYWLLRRYGQG